MKLRSALICALLFASTARAADGDVLRIHLLFTSDIHGYVDPREATFINPDFPPPMGGGASAASYIRRVREAAAKAADEAVLLVDAGDCWQGSPVGTLSDGRVMSAYYKALDYDAIACGNHEFDKGQALPEQMTVDMGQKFLACNVFVEETGELVDWVEPYRIVERLGLRIGIIGANTPGTEHMAFPENIAGLDFGPVLPNVERWRDHLLEVEGVDLVMLTVHEGLPFDKPAYWAQMMERRAAGEDMRESAKNAMEIAHVLTGVPVIVGGHTHQGNREPWIDPYTHAMVFEPFANGSAVGHAILLVDRGSGELLGYEPSSREGALVSLWEDEWWPDPEMQEVLRPYLEEAEEGLSVVVGSSRVELSRAGRSNSRMGNLVTEAMRWNFDAELAFSNTGGLRTDLKAGDLTLGDLMRLLPFGNSLVVVQLEGRMILDILDRKSARSSSGIALSGVRWSADPGAPDGERVLSCTIGGRPLEPDRLYRAVTSDYLMAGNSGYSMLTELPEDRVEYTQVLTREALQRYLEEFSPVEPRVDDRYQEEPDGERADYLRVPAWSAQSR